MTETSFPVVEKPLTEDQWSTIAHGFGQGVIDQGGFPYLIGNRDDVTDMVTINVDTLTGKNEAIVRGFVHSIDEPKQLYLPAVATTTTYEIGLVYDPANHGTGAGPVSLDVWTAPGDTTGGKVRVVLYRITRQPSTALSTATVVENRQRISPQIVVSGTADLPPTSAVLVDTVARVRTTGERWAAAINTSTGVVSWQKIEGTHPDLIAATWEPDPNTLMKRAGNGSVHAEIGTGGKSLVNKDYIDAQGTWDSVANSLARRGADGALRVKSSDSHPDNALNRSVGDTRYAYKSHDHQGSDIKSRVPYEHVDGSRAAYDTIQSGNVFTVSVNSTGDFMRFSSKRADKDEIVPLGKDVRALLAPEVVQYRRRDSRTGEVPEGARVEWGFIADDELAREDGVPELVLTEPDENGDPRPEGWDNAGLTAAHHRLLQWIAARVDAIDEHLGIDTEGAGA